MLEGETRVVLPPGLPDEMLGRTIQKQKGLLESARQLWRRSAYPEVRTPPKERKKDLTGRRKNAEDRKDLKVCSFTFKVFRAHVEANLKRPVPCLGALARKGSCTNHLRRIGRAGTSCHDKKSRPEGREHKCFFHLYFLVFFYAL